MMFVQDAPRLGNRLHRDHALLDALRRHLPAEQLQQVRPSLEAFAERADEFERLQLVAEAQPPAHVPFDAWGQRVDRIEVSPAWLELVHRGLEAGLVAMPYENAGPRGRVVQAAMVQLFQPVCAMATCPMAMTDGGVRLLLTHDQALADRYVPRLTRRHDVWTCAQWMTETTGGSDVSQTTTAARRLDDGRWQLRGTKWFTSATTADVALALARPDGAPPGSRGLSLFLLELRNADGSWNGLRVRRLKHKMGTHALPTAELDLDGAIGVPVGGVERGVAKVASMLNVTRLWTTYGTVGPTGHLLTLARDYAARREVLGRPLRERPIHTAWLSTIAAVYEAMVALSFQTAWHVGAAEEGSGDPRLARITTPLAKLACTRQGVWACSELLESFGGAGYLEDTGIPVVFRDAHVQVIWEGTTSVQAHDVLRAVHSDDAGGAFLDDLDRRVAASAGIDGMAVAHARIVDAATRLRPLVAALDETNARDVAWSMARTYQAALLCEAAAVRPDRPRLRVAAGVFSSTPLISAVEQAPRDLEYLAYLG